MMRDVANNATIIRTTAPKRSDQSDNRAAGFAGLGVTACQVNSSQVEPLTYNKDMQEDKEALFDTTETLSDSLVVMATVLRNVSVKGERMREAASRGFLNATDLADYLARRGMEFRRAHELVGRVASYSMDQGRPLEEITLLEYQSFSPLFDDDLYNALKLSHSLASKSATGGTAPERVREALLKAKSEVE